MSSADRVRGAFAGLAIGDAAGWPAARHRWGLLAPWTRRLGRELDAFAEEHGLTALPVPFALNQPVAPLAIGPSDDAEWLAWTATTMNGDRRAAFAALGAGRARPHLGPHRRWTTWRAAPGRPATGHDNPHFFDDAAAVRAVAFGAAHPGDPEARGRAACADAEITNAEDGVHGACAMAAAVAVAVAGGSADEVVARRARRAAAADTAIRHAALAALDGAAATPSRAVPALDAAVQDHVYSYGLAAAQTVPVALALTQASGGDLSRAVPGRRLPRLARRLRARADGRADRRDHRLRRPAGELAGQQQRRWPAAACPSWPAPTSSPSPIDSAPDAARFHGRTRQ